VFFLRYVYQKSMNSGQIIPLFTLVWDDKPKSKREKITRGFRPEWSSCCPSAFPNLARIHDEATTSDHGSDAGNQFNIAAGADEHHNSQEDFNGQKGSYKEGACRKPVGAPDTGVARADAKPAGTDRRPETAER
jgi:hypothetical protein